MTLRSTVLTVLLALVCALQFVPGVGMGEARAACSPSPGYGSGFESQIVSCTYRDQAYAAITSENNYLNTHSPQRFYTIAFSTTSCGSGYSCYKFSGISNGYGAPGYYARFPTASACPAGTTWNDPSKTCFSAAACLAKPSVPIGTLNISVAGVKFCSSGCEFEAKQGTQSQLTTGGGEQLNIYSGGAYTPSGNPCSAGQLDPPVDQPQQCVTDSSSTWPVCIKKTGEHCVKSKTGRQLCWKPFETGEKTDQDVLQVRNAGASAATPSTPPPPGESFTPGASVSETTTTTAADGTARTVTTTTTNYTTAGGTNASGSGDAPSDSGETGDGTGTADSNSDYGSAGDGVGNLYTKKTDTLDTSFADFSTQVQATPIVSAITGFFTFNESAACPIFTVPENEWVPAMTFDWFCTGVIAELLPLMGALCLAAAAWLGFKIGVVW